MLNMSTRDQLIKISNNLLSEREMKDIENKIEGRQDRVNLPVRYLYQIVEAQVKDGNENDIIEVKNNLYMSELQGSKNEVKSLIKGNITDKYSILSCDLICFLGTTTFNVYSISKSSFIYNEKSLDTINSSQLIDNFFYIITSDRKLFIYNIKENIMKSEDIDSKIPLDIIYFRENIIKIDNRIFLRFDDYISEATTGKILKFNFRPSKIYIWNNNIILIDTKISQINVEMIDLDGKIKYQESFLGKLEDMKLYGDELCFISFYHNEIDFIKLNLISERNRRFSNNNIFYSNNRKSMIFDQMTILTLNSKSISLWNINIEEDQMPITVALKPQYYRNKATENRILMISNTHFLIKNLHNSYNIIDIDTFMEIETTIEGKIYLDNIDILPENPNDRTILSNKLSFPFISKDIKRIIMNFI